MLTRSLGIRVIVDKKREIYFIDNVKFHIDEVEQLGTFVEIEAINNTGKISKEKLTEQCDHFIQLLGIRFTDLIECSYGDMILYLNNDD